MSSNTINMSFNEKQFSIELDDWFKKYQGNATDYVRAFVLRIFENIVRLTPVGNPDLWQNKPPPGYVGGNARNNWRASINVELDGWEPSNTKEKSEETVAKEIFSAIARGKMGDVFYLQNSVPYIMRLEHGWSMQAPTGMVAVTFASAQAFFQQAKNDVPGGSRL